MRAPTLSPTALQTLPIEDDNQLPDLQEQVMGSPTEIQPSLQAFKELLESGRTQEMLNRDMMTAFLRNETMFGESNDDEYSFLDPYARLPMPYHYLRNAGRTEGARLIKNNRILDLKKFGRPSFDKEQPGFDLVHKDPDYTPTTAEKEYLKHLKIQLCEKFFFKVGGQPSCIGLGTWLGLAYQDWFDVDDISCEIRRAGNGLPLGLHLVDPALIKPILPRMDTKGVKKNLRWDVIEDKDALDKIRAMNDSIGFSPKELDDREDEPYSYLLFKDNKRLAKYTNYRMFKAHFFQTTDYRGAYRGSSVVEQGIRMITNISSSISYNSANFDNNRTPSGVLAFEGGFTNRLMMQNYKTMLYSYLQNPNNRHKVPMFGLPQGGDMKWIPFGQSNKDMEFNLFMTLLFTILAKLSGTSPEEVGLASYENAMRGSQPFDKSPDGVLTISKDKGMNSFLYHIEDSLNATRVFPEIAKMNVKAIFRGLVVEDKQVKINWNTARLSTDTSLNQIQKENGQEPAVMMAGDINIYDIVAPNNPIVQQTLQSNIAQAQADKQQKQQAMQAQQDALNAPDQQAPEGGDVGGQQAPDDQNLVKQYGEPQQ